MLLLSVPLRIQICWQRSLCELWLLRIDEMRDSVKI